MTILEMIAEWRKGCSCATGNRPATCLECTEALIKAIESSEHEHERYFYPCKAVLKRVGPPLTETDFDWPPGDCGPAAPENQAGGVYFFRVK